MNTTDAARESRLDEDVVGITFKMTRSERNVLRSC